VKTHHPDEEEAPLRAIRTFEAFAQHGTIGQAAAELAITPSAVSHQLAALEQFLKTSLTQRRGRSLQLTEEGRNYYRAIHAALSMLRNATNDVREKSARRQIVIGVMPLFATGWLNHRIGEFLRLNPDLDINVRYAHYQSYLSDMADLSIRFGGGEWRGYRSMRVLAGAMVPVAAPSLMQRFEDVRTHADLLHCPLVHDGNRSYWSSWFAQAGIEPATSAGSLSGMTFEDGLLTTSAVTSGLGVGLLRKALIEHELSSGTLVQLFDTALDTGEDYYLCVREEEDLPEPVERVVQWIMRAVEDGASPQAWFGASAKGSARSSAVSGVGIADASAASGQSAHIISRH